MAGPSPSPVIGPAMTCCLPGFTYDSGTLKCINNLDPTIISDPVGCACCPRGNVFIDAAGYFNDPILGIIQISNPVKTAFFNTCATIVNVNWAIPSGNDPFTCPCCLPGFQWSSDIQACVDLSNKKHWVDPIPCIPCICTPNPPPPPPCPTCNLQTKIVPISFTFDPTSKHCVDCEVVGPPVGLGGCADSFFPIQIMDPIINFFLNP